MAIGDNVSDLEIREADSTDREAISDVAARSLQASYSLSPRAIERGLENWYGTDAFEDKLSDPDALVLVAERDELVGYAEGALVQEGAVGDIRWLHVAPERRGQGVGSRLFDRMREELEASGADRLRGAVLTDNREGNSFYEQKGFELADEETVEVAGTTAVENTYVDTVGANGSLTVIAGPEGERLYVDGADPDTGSRGPFHPVHRDADCETKYGFFCGNCETIVNAMDAMGRLECDGCGNTRKPTRWDAAYL